jgi:S1-C subfamily serine protease
MRSLRLLGRCGPFLMLVWLLSLGTALAQIPDLGTGRVPTLAPLVKEVTPAVVNISVQGKIREDNPLYHDPFFREFFDVPKQLEKEINATGSGVIVDAPGGGNIGIGFAVPINMAKKVMDQLIATGHVERGRIGVVLEDLDAPAGGHLEGARVKEVSPGSPAERAGVRKEDIILKADDLPIRSATQMRNLIGLTPVGQQVRLIIERDHAQEAVSVEVVPLTEQKPKLRGPG